MNDSISIVVNEFGSYDLLYDGDIRVQGIDESSIVRMNEGRLICGKYKLPEEALESGDIQMPVHYFIYDSKEARIHSFSCMEAFFSDYYTNPVRLVYDGDYCRIESFVPDSEKNWSVIEFISPNETLFLRDDGIVYLEKYAYSFNIDCPRMLNKNLKLERCYEKSVISDYVWKNITYRLLIESQDDSVLRDKCFKPSENTIDVIRSFIIDLQYRILQEEASEIYEDGSRDLIGRVSEENHMYLDYLISKIDVLIEKMEKNEEKHPSKESEDESSEESDEGDSKEDSDEGDSDYTERINPICYSRAILEEFEEFLTILEDELDVDIHEDITFLLYRCIRICRAVFTIKGGITFPCHAFNVFLRRIIKELNEEDDELIDIDREVSDISDRSIDIFREELLVEGDSRDYMDEYFYPFIDTRCSIIEDRPNHIYREKFQIADLLESKSFKTGMIGYVAFFEDCDIPYMLDCAPMPFGEINDEYEIHFSDKEFIDYQIDHGVKTRLFEVFYDLVSKCYCINNIDLVSEDLIKSTLNKLEKKNITNYCFVGGTDSSLSRSETFENAPYYGYVVRSDNGTLNEVKKRFSSTGSSYEEDILLLNPEKGDEVVYQIGYSWRDGTSIIISEQYDFDAFANLEESFNIRQWKWQRKEC